MAASLEPKLDATTQTDSQEEECKTWSPNQATCLQLGHVPQPVRPIGECSDAVMLSNGNLLVSMCDQPMVKEYNQDGKELERLMLLHARVTWYPRYSGLIHGLQIFRDDTVLACLDIELAVLRRESDYTSCGRNNGLQWEDKRRVDTGFKPSRISIGSDDAIVAVSHRKKVVILDSKTWLKRSEMELNHRVIAMALTGDILVVCHDSKPDDETSLSYLCAYSLEGVQLWRRRSSSHVYDIASGRLRNTFYAIIKNPLPRHGAIIVSSDSTQGENTAHVLTTCNPFPSKIWRLSVMKRGYGFSALTADGRAIIVINMDLPGEDFAL